MNLSAHFTLEEITRSETAVRLGIDNSLPPEMLETWRAGCDTLEAIRTIVNAPITISSGYRCPELNKRIAGSSVTSQHTGKWRGLYCCAFDIQSPAGNDKLFHAVRLSNLDFDQLIWEYGNDTAPAWVHIGLVFERKMRNQLLRKRAGTKRYEEFA